MARNPKQDANLRLIQKGELSSEEAKVRGSAGGRKSGEARRMRRDAKKTIQYILELDAVGNTKENLKRVGIPEEACSNMTATWVKCYTEWLRTGNVKLWEVLMKYGGFDEAELRKAKESDARIRAMDKSGIPVFGEADPTKSEVFVVLPDDGRSAPGAVAISEEEADALMADQ